MVEPPVNEAPQPPADEAPPRETWESRSDPATTGQPSTITAPPIIFNFYARPTKVATPGAKHYYSNDPAIELTIDFWALRHSFSTALLSALEQEVTGSKVFEYDQSDPQGGTQTHPAWPRYAALGCKVKRLSDLNPRAASALDREPPKPYTRVERQKQLDTTVEAGAQENPGDLANGETNLWLFNVVIAFEWWPLHPGIGRQIEWMCRQASDFLLDATDGYIALGNIVLGGPDLMGCADIQVFASNRLFPRSWVGGMYVERKYSPIRVGRGIWHKNRNVSIPWDEPESYRTLVHEWAHYALGLKDRYLVIRRGALPPGGKDGRILEEDAGVPAGEHLAELTVPTISLPIDSIMSTTEGTSEFTPRLRADQPSEWEEIARVIPWLQLDQRNIIDQGPGRLSLPLPAVLRHRADDPDPYLYVRLIAPVWDQNGVLRFPTFDNAQPKPRRLRLEGQRFLDNELLLLPIAGKQGNRLDTQPLPCIGDAHCWVFLVRKEGSEPQALIAQGTLENRPGDEGFQLVGAQLGDWVVLIGNDPQGAPTVLTWQLSVPLHGQPQQWDLVKPTKFPLVDVYATNFERDDTSTRRISYSIRVAVSEPGWNAWVFPLGSSDPMKVEWVGEPHSAKDRQSDAIDNIPSLDGHILLQNDAGQMTIVTYSIGGTPANAFPASANPIAAGSSEGNAMLFFHSPNPEPVNMDAEEEEKLVVTTLNYGIGAPVGYDARSYTFSITTNRPLPTNKNATLVFYYDRAVLSGEGEIVLMRAHSSQPAWEEIPSFSMPGQPYVATPLFGSDLSRFTPADGDQSPPATAPGLFDANLTAEHYRLCLRR